MTRRPLTPVDRTDIVDAYRDGYALAALAAEWGRTKGTIRQVVVDAGVEIRPPGRAAGTGPNRQSHAWVLTQAGMDLVRPSRPVPASAATRAIVTAIVTADRTPREVAA